MWKLRKSSPLSFVLSPGIGCYLSVITSLQERMMTIPDPVASTACTEETSLTCDRKEKEKKKKSSPVDSIKPRGFNLPLPEAASAVRERARPPPRSRPRSSWQTSTSSFPPGPDPRGRPPILLPLALPPERTPGSSESSGQRPGGARHQGGSPLASCRPPFPPSARRRGGRRRGGSPRGRAGGGGGRRGPASPVPGADHHAVRVAPWGPRAPQRPGAECEEPREEERAPGQRQQHGCSGVGGRARRPRLGSGRLRATPDWRSPPAPISTLRPPSPPRSRPRPAATPAAAGRWPRARSATLRVTRPAAAIGAGRPGGAGSRRRRPWAPRLPRVPPAGRRVGGGGELRPGRFRGRGRCAPHERRGAVAAASRAAAGPGQRWEGPRLSGLLFRHRGRVPLPAGPARPKKRPAPAHSSAPQPQAKGPGRGGGPEKARFWWRPPTTRVGEPPGRGISLAAGRRGRVGLWPSARLAYLPSTLAPK